MAKVSSAYGIKAASWHLGCSNCICQSALEEETTTSMASKVMSAFRVKGARTVIEAIERGVAAGVRPFTVRARFSSRQADTFKRLIAALRNEFGGHAVKKG